MRKFKGFVCFASAVFLLLSACISVSGTGKTYYIEELKMSMDIPENMSVTVKGGNSQLAQGVYLEALSPQSGLKIRVLMEKDEKTREFFNLSLLSSSALEEYENAILENSQYSDCTRGEYGGVLFLDFSTYDSVGDTYVYGRQSVTVVNGMSIVVASVSEGDALSSDELSLIKSVLESIKFDEILSNSSGVSPLKIIVIVLIVLGIIAVGFIFLSYFMNKKSKAEKRLCKRETERKKDYDVLSRAERKNLSEKSDGGYFEEDAENSTLKTIKNGGNKSRNALKSTGYFFKNLKRELTKGNNRSPKASKSEKKHKGDSRKPRDFDVFNDKI